MDIFARIAILDEKHIEVSHEIDAAQLEYKNAPGPALNKALLQKLHVLYRKQIEIESDLNKLRATKAFRIKTRLRKITRSQ